MKKLFLLLLILFFYSCSANMAKSRSYESGAYMEAPQSTGAANKNKAVSNSEFTRKIIYNVSVRIQAQKIEEKVQELIELAKKYDGYSIQYSSNGNMTLKIPAEQLMAFLKKVKSTSEQYYEELKATDVTEEFYDLEIRLDNHKKMKDRLIEILKKAKSVEEILKVEAELNKTTGEIDRIEGRLKYLSANISYSTVQISILKKYEAPKDVEYKPGPLGYPFYYLYIGTNKLIDGIIWLFVQPNH